MNGVGVDRRRRGRVGRGQRAPHLQKKEGTNASSGTVNEGTPFTSNRKRMLLLARLGGREIKTMLAQGRSETRDTVAQ